MSVKSSGSRNTKRSPSRTSGRGRNARSTRPNGRSRTGSLAPAPTALRAADNSEERTGSAFRAVGNGIGTLFGATARGVGGLTRGAAALGRDLGGRATVDDDMLDTTVIDTRGKKEMAAKKGSGKRGKATAADKIPTTVVAGDRDPADSGRAGAGFNADGIGLALIGLAAVLGASVWLDIAGPIGEAIAHVIHLVIGAGALLLPLALVVVAVMFMLDLPRPNREHARVAVGSGIILVAMLGRVHIFAGTPSDWEARKTAGGAIGTWTGGLLAAGFSS